MPELQRLDWIRLHIDKLLSSPRVQQMKDFQFGWYIKLLLHLTRSDRVGYLPLDERLWELAGAHRREYWETHNSAVLACFKARELDGQSWIYSERMLTELGEQSNKVTNLKKTNKDGSVPIRVSVSGLPVSQIYEAYPRKEGRSAAFKAIEKAILRYAKEKELDPIDAAEFIQSATEEYAKSPAGKVRDDGDFRPHPATWFNQDRFLDDRALWYREEKRDNRSISKAEQRTERNVRIARELAQG
jgi:hypothetical protein